MFVHDEYKPLDHAAASAMIEKFCQDHPIEMAEFRDHRDREHKFGKYRSTKPREFPTHSIGGMPVRVLWYKSRLDKIPTKKQFPRIGEYGYFKSDPCTPDFSSREVFFGEILIGNKWIPCYWRNQVHGHEPEMHYVLMFSLPRKEYQKENISDGVWGRTLYRMCCVKVDLDFYSNSEGR